MPFDGPECRWCGSVSCYHCHECGHNVLEGHDEDCNSDPVKNPPKPPRKRKDKRVAGIKEITYSYKQNPQQYHTEEVAITLAVGDGESPAEVTCAARALVLTGLGQKPTKKDRAAAKAYLARHYGEGINLRDFAPGD